MCALPQAKETVVLPGGHVVHTVTGHKWVEIPLQYPFPKENEEKRRVDENEEKEENGMWHRKDL